MNSAGLLSMVFGTSLLSVGGVQGQPFRYSQKRAAPCPENLAAPVP
jgi:hypothetical protein